MGLCWFWIELKPKSFTPGGVPLYDVATAKRLPVPQHYLPVGNHLIAGLGGASLTLFYPGSWNEGISSGQGLIAVALVIFARWSPLRCIGAAALFGAAGAIGPALQSVGITQGYYFFNAAPYVLTLLIMIISTSPKRSLKGAPAELTITK